MSWQTLDNELAFFVLLVLQVLWLCHHLPLMKQLGTGESSIWETYFVCKFDLCWGIQIVILVTLAPLFFTIMFNCLKAYWDQSVLSIFCNWTYMLYTLLSKLLCHICFIVHSASHFILVCKTLSMPVSDLCLGPIWKETVALHPHLLCQHCHIVDLKCQLKLHASLYSFTCLRISWTQFGRSHCIQ